MYCQIYKKLNCVGCPEEMKDYCEGVKLDLREWEKNKRHERHERRNYSTWKQIKKYVTFSNSLDLTSSMIVDKIRENNKRIVTNNFYVNEVMQRLYKWEKINGKIYYYAKFLEPLY